MKAPLYAAALFRAIKESAVEQHDSLVERFVSIVRERGHARLFPAIITEYEKLVARRARTDECTLVLAQREDAERLRSEIDSDRSVLGDGREPHLVVDERVIGGYVLSGRGTRIDRTHRRALLDLYHRLVNNI